MEENQVHIPYGWVKDSFGNILNYEQPYKYTVDLNEMAGQPTLHSHTLPSRSNPSLAKSVSVQPHD